MDTTLATLNAADLPAFLSSLDGLYEHSPWIAERTWQARPAPGWASAAALLHALATTVEAATVTEQLALIRAHPELAGKAMVARALTAESAHEQQSAGLSACSPEEFEKLHALNRAYNGRFGWPFILAVRGPRGAGLSRAEIIATFERRVAADAEAERAECLRQVHRIAQLRLNDRLGWRPELGDQVWDWAGALARHTDDADPSVLTVAYLTPAHRACAQDLAGWMRDCGFDEVRHDAVGNVVGLYRAASGDDAPRLLTGSHYDTVRDAGPHDGRIGILVPMAVVRAFARAGRRPPVTLEVVAFAEEEGLRYKAAFLGSSPLAGQFEPEWLEQQDAAGIPLHAAMAAAGLPGELAAIRALRRDPARYLGFVEVHIEQGPVLFEAHKPLGVVTSINGSRRFRGEAVGQAGHAGTTPMERRRDAAAAVAEIVLRAEADAHAGKGIVATAGLLEVPGGSINVVPGRCRFSLDVRAPDDARRDALADGLLRHVDEVAARRRVRIALEEIVRVRAAPSDPALQARWEAAVRTLGLPLHRLPSGAGHDAMMLHRCMPQAMLVVRGQNDGISHNPLESTTSDDLQLACEAFAALLDGCAAPEPRPTP